MVAYNFQPNFERDIARGVKISTIRPEGKRRHAQVGEEVQLYTGQRTRNCRLIARARCVVSRPVVVIESGLLIKGASGPEFQRDMAKIEGFESIDDLVAWFRGRYGLPATSMRQIIWNLADESGFKKAAPETGLKGLVAA